MFCNILTAIVAYFYFKQNGGFDKRRFIIGFFGSFFDTIGIVCITKAFSNGPGGLVAALCTSTNIILTVLEAIKHQRTLSNMEWAGLVLGVYGALIISIPDLIIKYCFCCF